MVMTTGVCLRPAKTTAGPQSRLTAFWTPAAISAICQCLYVDANQRPLWLPLAASVITHPFSSFSIRPLFQRHQVGDSNLVVSYSDTDPRSLDDFDQHIFARTLSMTWVDDPIAITYDCTLVRLGCLVNFSITWLTPALPTFHPTCRMATPQWIAAPRRRQE